MYGSGTYYGDASGGELTSYSDLRRCGCALVKINNNNGVVLYGASFNLPGKIQTVGRGEAYALVYLIDRAKADSHIDFVTDNKGVYIIVSKGPVAGSKSLNSDLYAHIFSVTMTEI